jgi:PAS domain S-box-containing protein
MKERHGTQEHAADELAALRRRADELEALGTTMAEITAELELPTLLRAILERAAGLVDATGGELGLYSADRQEVQVVVSYNLDEGFVGTRHSLGEGAMGRVAETGEPLVVEDYQTWEGRAPQYAGVRVHAILAAPLMAGQRLVGVITLATADPTRKFGPDDLHLLYLFGQQAAIAIENARLFSETERRVAELATLTDIGKALSSTLRVDQLLRLIHEQTRRAMHADDMLILLYDGERHELECVFSTNPEDIPVGLRASADSGISSYIVRHRKSLLLRGDVVESARAMGLEPVGEPSASWMGVPMVRGERVLGLIIAQHYTERDVYDESHQVILETIASQAAIAIENARLYDQAQREIAERMRAEEALRKYQERLEERVEERTAELRQSEERYRTLFDGIPIGLYRSTPAGQMIDANLALAQMLGYQDREQLLAITDATITYVDPQERLRWQTLMEREGVVRDFETRMVRPDGTVIWANDTARAVRDEQGRVLHYEGSLEDITERKRAEEELRKYQEHLEELVEARTAELRASEERYRTLFDGVPIGLYRTTPDGRVLEMNLAGWQMIGYGDRDEALRAVSSAAQPYADPHQRARWQVLMEQEGIVRDFEQQLIRRDGKPIWVSDTARVVKDEAGQVLYYEGSLEDITERKQFEEEIRRQKDYFEALFLNSPVAVVTADLEGKVVSWNPMAEKLFGYTPEEATGVSVDDLVAGHESIRAEAAAYSEQVTREGRVQATTRRARKDGSLVDVELLAVRLVLAGELVGFISIYHDISERTRIEGELRRQKEYFEALFLNSPVAALTADLNATVTSWNPMAEKLFGYTQEESVGRHVDDLVANDPAIRQDALAKTNQLLATDRVQATVKRTRKDGTLIDVEVLALPVIVAGEKVGYLGIYVDVSELQQARREAEAANQAKSIFLANMSHELRTPLNAILGFSQLMDRAPNLTAEQQENLTIINRSGEHLLALINDVLEMSKIEAGRVTLKETAFDLHGLLDGLEEMFRLRAEDGGLTLSFHKAEGVPRYVVADEGKLRQVLSNLLGNAVKFTQEGGVALRVAAQRDETVPDGWLLRIEVEDTGPGIPPDELETVFDPFVQAAGGDLASARLREGTGLGLSISRQFARLMGGDILVSSELGQGSLFQFEVPVALVSAAEVEAARPRRRVVGLAADQGAPDGGSYRLLVAEDRETNRRLLVRLLGALGFEVREAANGQEAIEVWEGWRPHLIWMDMRMPLMDGHEATRRIKATPRGQATVIIALTATAFEEDREQILLEGCDDFVRKPFRDEQIYDMLAAHLGVRFVYEEEPPGPAPAALSVGALAALPASWLANLRGATTRADLSAILDLIDGIRERDAALAEALAILAGNYEYKKILTLIEQAGGER